MNLWERDIYFGEYLPAIINKNIYPDIPVMRWCSKFERSGIAANISTEQRIPAASGKIQRRP